MLAETTERMRPMAAHGLLLHPKKERKEKMAVEDTKVIDGKLEKAKIEKKQAKKKERKKKKSQFWADFKKFIARGNVVDMAIGVAVASAFTAIVKAFTNGFVSPILALLGKEGTMENMKWVLRQATYSDAEKTQVLTPEVAILWGSFLQAIFDFLIIAFTFFLILRIYTSLKKRADKIASDIKKITDEEAEKERLAAEEKAKIEAKAKEEADKAKAEADAKALAEKQKIEAEFYANVSEQNELLKKIKELLEAQK